ncbi:hypothetical protein D3C81_2312890 [compost metagenome]
MQHVHVELSFVDTCLQENLLRHPTLISGYRVGYQKASVLLPEAAQQNGVSKARVVIA